MFFLKYILVVPFLVFLFLGCSVKYDNVDLNKKDFANDDVQNLTNKILSISKNIDKKEARELSYDAITYSKYLANKYELVSPPLFHNFLVNYSVKEKGLCHHFAKDLLAYLNRKNYKSFKLKRIVAQRKEYFEHNGILLTPSGVDFEDSLVLDAWRNSGELFWIEVKNDDKYIWEFK